MKNKIILVLVILLFVVPLAPALLYPDHPTVTLLSQDPDPAEPGQVVEVKFKIENDGEQTSEDVVVKIVPKSPFSIYNDVAEKNIGKIRAGQTGADAVIVEFKVKIDEEAVEGEAEIDVLLKVADGAWVAYTDGEFTVDIQTHDAVLEVVKITSDPEQVPPGGTAIIEVLVKNLADSLLKDIRFKLDLDSADIPLAPYQSSSEGRIPLLKSGYQKSLSFQLIASPDAQAGMYKVPLNISYNDEKGNHYRINDVLAVLVGERPKLKAYIKKSTSLQDDKPATITLELANPGTTDIKFLEVSLLPSEDYQLVTVSDYIYIGDLDSDDTESEEIDIFIDRKVKVLEFPVKLKYTDANNQAYQQQFNLKLNLHSSYTLKKFGLISSSNTGTMVGLILISAGAFYLYRRKKKNKKVSTS
ncbi:LPXTG cell wall anchor domain-containing protein [Candidatus Woesearchaeota archaeon]|nr:LPXTG cell wall anchor domain-containing protein [Candidatus Woesearchaeota archaeon]